MSLFFFILSFNEDWMSLLSDSALYQDVVIPGSHNSGAINCKLAGIILLDWLTCQQDHLYTQLRYGVRGFDLRVIPGADGMFFFGHGVCIGEINVIEGFLDIRKFIEEHPSEIISLYIHKTDDHVVMNEAEIRLIISTILNPERFAFSTSDPDLSKATMGEIRACKKNLIISSPWIDSKFAVGRDSWDTWTSEYNFGPLEAGEQLYDHIYDLLNGDNWNMGLSLNRASGGGTILPLSYMLHDYSMFADLIVDFQKNPIHLQKVISISFDFTTYDTIQIENVIGLNAYKGLFCKSFQVSLMIIPTITRRFRLKKS
jgi:hypothetical protein